jgi:hypothetical protein
MFSVKSAAVYSSKSCENIIEPWNVNYGFKYNYLHFWSVDEKTRFS